MNALPGDTVTICIYWIGYLNLRLNIYKRAICVEGRIIFSSLGFRIWGVRIRVVITIKDINFVNLLNIGFAYIIYIHMWYVLYIFMHIIKKCTFYDGFLPELHPSTNTFFTTSFLSSLYCHIFSQNSISDSKPVEFSVKLFLYFDIDKI